MILGLSLALIFVGFILFLSYQIRFFASFVMLQGLRAQEPDISRAGMLEYHQRIQAGLSDDNTCDTHPLQTLLARDFKDAIWYLTMARHVSRLCIVTILGLLAALLFSSKYF